MKKNNVSKVVLLSIAAAEAILAVLLSGIFPNHGWAQLISFVLVASMAIILACSVGEKYNGLKVLLISILAFALLSWILPAAYYSNGYVEQGRTQMGLFDLFNYLTASITYFGYIAVYVLVVGGLYGVLNKIGAYRVMLDKMAKGFKGGEKFVLVFIIVLLTVLTSVCGLQLGLIVFIPMLISLLLLMGFDKTTTALAIVGSLLIGIAGSTCGYANTSVIVSTLGTNLFSHLIFKIIILVFGTGLLILNTLLYVYKCEKSKKKTTKAAKVKKEVLKKEDEKFVPDKVSARKKVTLWPLIVMFSLMFCLLIVAFTSWAGIAKIKVFEDVTKAVTEFKLFGFPLFGKVLGGVNAFGVWTVAEMVTVTVIATLLLSFIYKVKFDEMIEGFIAGVKKAAMPALVVVLAYTCLVIAAYHPFQLAVYKAVLDMTSGFSVIISGSLTAVFAGIINVDPAYTFQSVLPYFASVVDKSDYSLAALIFQSVYGVVMLLAPTSAILMGVLSYLEIPYKKWLKNSWLLICELLLLVLLVFIAVVLLGIIF